MKKTRNSSEITVGLMIWDGPLRDLVGACLSLLGVKEISLLPTIFSASLSRDFLQVFSSVDLAMIEAFNSSKNIRDAEGFRLAKTLALADRGGFRPLVLFRSMPDSLRPYPCFIDFATFGKLGSSMEEIMRYEPDSAAFAAAEQAWPELARIPVHG